MVKKGGKEREKKGKGEEKEGKEKEEKERENVRSCGSPNCVKGDKILRFLLDVLAWIGSDNCRCLFSAKFISQSHSHTFRSL